MAETLTEFVDGSQGSASALFENLSSIQATGQAVLDSIESAQTSVLLDLEQSLQVLNSRQQRASRLTSSDVVCRFLVSDFESIDQTRSSATIRIDSQSVSLRERAQPADVNIRKQIFTTTSGTVQQIGNYFQVNVPDGSTPTGSFNLELAGAVSLTMIVFDIVSLAGQPGIQVFVSSDGVVYIQAEQVAVDGYRVNAWFSTQGVKYIRIQITPAHPDNLGGTTFTFGLTDFYASAVEFHLVSDLVTSPIKAIPLSNQLQFQADDDPGLEYYLSFDNVTFQRVIPGQIINVPGATAVSVQGVAIDSGGGLVHTVVPGLYYQTVQITGANGVPYRFAPNVDPSLVPQNPYISYWFQRFYLLPFNAGTESGLTFNVSYTSGPPALYVTLHVRLSTKNSSTTPVFHGATLQNV